MSFAEFKDWCQRCAYGFVSSLDAVPCAMWVVDTVENLPESDRESEWQRCYSWWTHEFIVRPAEAAMRENLAKAG